MANSKPLESRLASLPKSVQEQFAADCADIFSANAGQRVLQMLCKLTHPLTSPLRDSDRDTFAEIGRKEVTALLFRRVDDHAKPSLEQIKSEPE